MDHFEIAIVGAGISGLMAATYLAEKGKKSVLFDKGRGPGGRMSTRRFLVSRSMSRVGRKLG
ncbi:MAG: FAD-dependent oxidoreductase [Deltaproteobacteria bacterium]